MDSPQKAQALIDYLKISGPAALHVDVLLTQLYHEDMNTMKIEDRLWVLNHVLGAVRRTAIGESVELVESTCQHLYDLARANRSVRGAEGLASGIAQVADKLMMLTEGVRKENGLDEATPE